MEMKEVLLKGNNLEIADKMIEVIPYAKAELEFKFWKQLYERYNKDIEKLGFYFIDDGEFPYNTDSTIETIREFRKTKDCGYWIDYFLGEYKNCKVMMCIGNSGYDERIYVSLGLSDGNNNEISYKEYDKELLELFINFGFNKSGTYKYRYIKYDLNFHSNIYKLTSETIMNEAVTCTGNEIIEISKKISQSKELKAMLN